MIQYTGLNCPVCGQPFQEHDDVVVCPDCGAPHHRDCYTKTGHCALQDKHGTDQDWAHQHQQKEPDPAQRTKECPRCHTQNDESALFCKSCGQSLQYYSDNVGSAPSQEDSPPNQQQGPGQPPPPGGFPFSGNPYANPSNPYDPLGGIPADEDLGGATAGDLAKLVRANSRYYLPVFARIRAFNRTRFSFVAFLFGGGWFLYRKQYLLGMIFSLATIGLNVAQILVANLVLVPLMMEANPSFGINMTVYSLRETLSQVMERGPGFAFLCWLPAIFTSALFLLRIVMGVLANRLYYKHCVKTVQAIRSLPQQDAGAAELQFTKKGGVNMALAAVLFALSMVVSFFPSILLST